MFKKFAVAASLSAAVIAVKPAMATKPKAFVTKTTHNKTVTVHHLSDEQYTAKDHESDANWARRQVDQWNHSSDVHSGHVATQNGYKWVQKSYWTKEEAVVKNAHHAYETCKANFHAGRGYTDVNAWKNSSERLEAKSALKAELERARKLRGDAHGKEKRRYKDAEDAKQKIIDGAQGEVDNARNEAIATGQDTATYMKHVMNKAGRIKSEAMTEAKNEKAEAELKLKAAKHAANKEVRNAAWKAKQLRLAAQAKKDKAKSKAAKLAEKAHEVKQAMIARAKAKKEAAHAEARAIERKALAKVQAAKKVALAKERVEMKEKEEAAHAKRREARHKYRHERRVAHRAERKYKRDKAREARMHHHTHQQEGCEEHETYHVQHHHEQEEAAYVKQDYWVKEPVKTVTHKVTKHAHLEKYSGKSESSTKLEKLQAAAMSASAAYRKQVDMVNASNEERYAAYIKKVSHARKAEMHKREMRLVEVDKKIAAYKNELETGADHRLQVRREIEAKKLEAIRAEYYRQLHAAEKQYKKSHIVENFDDKLSAYRKKIMLKSDEGKEFRSTLQKKILKKLSDYQDNLNTVESKELETYKTAMENSAKQLSNYTALYAAGSDVSSSRKAYWAKYAKDLGLDSVNYQTTVVHHHHHIDGSVHELHDTHEHTITIEPQHTIKVATKTGHKNLKVVTESEDLPHFPGHETHFYKTTHHVSSHSDTVDAISHARTLVHSAKIAISKAKAGKLSKDKAQNAVHEAKKAVMDAHKKMKTVIESKDTSADDHTKIVNDTKKMLVSVKGLHKSIAGYLNKNKTHSDSISHKKESKQDAYAAALAKIKNMEDEEDKSSNNKL